MNRKFWEPLLKYESTEYVKRYFYTRHGRDLNSRHKHEITSSFIQGREYYSSGLTASDVVKPLLLYYAVCSIAKGIALLSDGTKRPENFTSGHGLKPVGWSKLLSDGPNNIIDLSVECTRGLFREFIESTGNGQPYQCRYTYNQVGYS